MREQLNLIVMLTHNDKTVLHAREIFEQCKDSKAEIWGMKEQPLALEELKALFAYMKRCGKTTVLEVVSYTKEEGLRGAEVAVECGCDILMGTKYFDEINEVCVKHRIKYMPFVGEVKGRPSILEGTIQGMLQEAEQLQKKGVWGVDLLGYRYTGDALALNKAFTESTEVPVCIAGSINGYKRLDELKQIRPWAFTIGGAFFENKFDGTFKEQINKVCSYLEEVEETDA